MLSQLVMICSASKVKLAKSHNGPVTVGVIPARGGSRGIPRKNARLLNGRPLIEYVIKAAQSARLLDAVFLSTDDSELKAIAETLGIPVLDRPEALAGPDTTLDEVTCDALEQLRRQGIDPEFVITLQATCPLLSGSTIDRAIEQITTDSKLETVVSVVKDTHLEWELDDSGQAVPCYEKRVNRQYLPPKYREAGAVVVCRRDVIEFGSRFGQSIGLLEVPRMESIDIDDYFDWWLAEKSLRRRRICFNVLGNAEQGLGHAYRVLTLADRLIDHELHFVLNERSLMAADLIKGRYYPVTLVPEGEELEAIRRLQPDLVVNDVLNTEAPFVEALKSFARVINFEDLGPGAAQADAVINAMYKSTDLLSQNEVYSGIQYCCLRDEFYSITPRKPKDEVRQILLLFGGTDASGGTLKLLDWLDRLEGDWVVNVVVGMGYRDLDSLKTKAECCRHKVQVTNDTRVISRHMHQADLAITSAGRTVFELASLGVPMMVYAQNDRETKHPFAIESHGTVYMGGIDRADFPAFEKAANELLSSRMLRARMHQSLLGENPRGGIEQVLAIIQRHLENPEIHVVRPYETSFDQTSPHSKTMSLPGIGGGRQSRGLAVQGI
jgi:CMP-N-acetylneuraminic acid synthetase/spore coat polysaccharide biosynthesis predicted glycosyltransferase SpsG